MLGLIAGTGFYDWSHLKEQEEIVLETPYGVATVYKGHVETAKGNVDVVFLPRHMKGHTVPPHMINYRANIYALKMMEVKDVVAITAVGSLHADIAPGEIVLIDDFLDFTTGREHTFFTGGASGVVHTDMTDCYAKSWQAVIKQAAQNMGISMIEDGVYVTMNGPRFETRIEIKILAQLGGTVVGMTGAPEVMLANELGMRYAGISMVTNFGCGLCDSIDGDHVSAIMAENAVKLTGLLKEVVEIYEG